MGADVQFIVVAVIVAISLLYMVGRVVPRWRKGFAQHLQQANYPAWLNKVGTKLGGSAGCGSGCSTCGSCSPKGKNASAES